MIHLELQARVREALGELIPESQAAAVAVRPCPDPRFGDYQVAALMGIARARGLQPRRLAEQVAERIRVGEWCDPPEVAGGGFLNFRVRPEALAVVLRREALAGGLFLCPPDRVQTVLVDFSSPNVAKPMHVGHIRSTILGDSLARILRLVGHRVITDNHIGDWGTQFGKLLVGWKRHLDADALAASPLEEMERLYRLVNQAVATNPEVLEESRRELVALQRGDPGNRELWDRMLAVSRAEFDRIYRRLGVSFDHTLGESFYDARLEGVTRGLAEKGIAEESEGAQVVFFGEQPDLTGHPAIVRKSDGAANYATTDLATLQYRWETWRPDEILYVTDGRQQLHFRQVFAIFRRWYPEATVALHHVWFGSILGLDGRPFRTRDGETVRLTELLDEAEERAYGLVTAKNPALPEAMRREIARIVGLGAVKYADLLPGRQSDYVFDWDRMLALNGNTAPYLQYAYARIKSIFRRAGLERGEEAPGAAPVLAEELELAKHLVNFGFVLGVAAEEHRPNHLCNYLYELASRFARFYERCPVLKAADDERVLRLRLCDLTARVLREGLGLLGIETLEQM